MAKRDPQRARGCRPAPLHVWTDAWTSGENRDPVLAEVVAEKLAMGGDTPALRVAVTVTGITVEVERCQRQVDTPVE